MVRRMRRLPLLLCLGLSVLAGCAEPRTPAVPVIPPTPATAADASTTIELVESAPTETTLDHADVRNASVVWVEMIDRAKTSIALSEFYASDVEGEQVKPNRPSQLTPVIDALKKATNRGVRVRFLADKSFAPKYPSTIATLEAAKVTVRTIDAGARYGGVQHSKYIVVDDEESFVGSQNFDWRALEHIQEIGARVHSKPFASALLDVFETDWALTQAAAMVRAKAAAGPRAAIKTITGETVSLYASPKDWIPDETHWDLTHLVAMLDAARSSIAIQVLTYATTNRDKTPFTTLDEAVRRAAGRGVKVRLLVSHWGANGHARSAVEALGGVGNVEVRVIEIPKFSGGDIPFARVSHAKYMVVDDRAAWIGTSNWEGDYFTKSRNVAVVSEGGALAPRLGRIFDDGWTSAYTKPLASTGAPATSAPATGGARAPGGSGSRPSSSGPARP